MLKKILMATDFSAASKAALKAAIHFARASGAALHVVHVLPKMEGRLYKVMSRLAEKDMQAFFPSRQHSNKKILFCDSAPEAILKYAREQDCGLIVLGSKDRSGIGDFLTGSVIRHLNQATRIPLMLVCKTPKRILVSFDYSALSKRTLGRSIKSMLTEKRLKVAL